MKKISSGAYAQVFLANKIHTGDTFAVKVTPISQVQKSSELKRVLLEKEILLQFDNPFIVNFYYSISGARNLYLVMEFLPGGDLYSLLQKVGSLDESSARIYTAQIVAALRYLHSNRITHRDLKPDNILVAADGHLKLADFGLSYLGQIEESRSFVGTPDYIAPEIILKQPQSYTVDYWALGIMIYEFLYGIPPFHCESISDLQQRILCGRFEFGDLDRPLSPEVRDLISRLLITSPDKRLGAAGIREILEHPWFEGISWDEVEKLRPPFVPNVCEEAPTTDYFEERNVASMRGEDDILNDIMDVVKPNEPLKRHGSLPGSAIESLLATEFPAVAVERLGKLSGVVANRLRKRASSTKVCVRSPLTPSGGS